MYEKLKWKTTYNVFVYGCCLTTPITPNLKINLSRIEKCIVYSVFEVLEDVLFQNFKKSGTLKKMFTSFADYSKNFRDIKPVHTITPLLFCFTISPLSHWIS